jgi:hypothetical protein
LRVRVFTKTKRAEETRVKRKETEVQGSTRVSVESRKGTLQGYVKEVRRKVTKEVVRV